MEITFGKNRNIDRYLFHYMNLVCDGAKLYVVWHTGFVTIGLISCDCRLSQS
jgi:hypothetical protein